MAHSLTSVAEQTGGMGADKRLTFRKYRQLNSYGEDIKTIT